MTCLQYADGDELLPDAVEVILESGIASVSMIQRRLNLGYARAARIMDEMEEKGIVGPFQGSKPRSILVTKEQWYSSNTSTYKHSNESTAYAQTPKSQSSNQEWQYMNRCKYCFHPLENNAKFCSSCGKPQGVQNDTTFDTGTSPSLRCSRCGGTNIKVELRAAGTTSTTNYYRTGVKKSLFFPSNQKTHKSNRNYKSIAFCQDCGDYWEIVSSNELHMIEQGKRYLKRIGIFLLCLFTLAMCTAGNDDAEKENSASGPSPIWAADYTPLSDFEYYIDNEEIYLKDYEGSSDNVYIAPSYDVGDRILPVVSLDGTFALASVDSVIISEGIIQLSNHTFNSCGIQYLYLPSTLYEFAGWSYFHDVEKIYYGGSKDSWDYLFQYDRSQLEVVEIVCNATIEELLANP